MTIKKYSTLPDWQSPELHYVDCDIGPDADVTPEKVAIHGDRWKHKRLGIATAPGATILQPIDAAAIEAPYKDIYEANGAYYIPVLRTKGFNDGDKIFIEDKNACEVLTITAVNENQSLQIPMPGNTYSINANLLVSSIPDIHVSKNEDLTAGDYVEICEKDGNNKIVCRIMPDSGSFKGVDNTTYSEKTIIRAIRLAKGFRKDDYVSVLNTNTKWTKNAANPIIDLQKEYPWDWAGQDVSSAEFLTDVDVMDEYEAPDGKKVSWRKPGLFITGGRERDSNQIGLMLSGKEDDTENWSSFLGDTNSTRPNPIIRHGNETEHFNYADTDALKKLWDTKDGNITVSLDNLAGNSCMHIDYTGDGEVWGLCPVPFNAEVRTDEANRFEFRMQGDAGNSEGDVYINLLAADGSSFIHNFPNVLQLGVLTDKSFDFNDPSNIFPGRKYLKAVIVGISTSGPASGTIYIDRVKPFLPASWDEIVEDPTVIQGNLEETPGVHAMYFTARERPRQIITSITGTAGSTNCIVDVPSTAHFDAGDRVILYDRDNYEVGMVDIVNSSTRLTVKHVSFDEDIHAKFDFDLSPSRQAMIANNSYRVSKIGGAYVLTEDCSDWEKWITDDNSQPVLIPSDDASAWDALSVKQPSVRIYGNDVYMAYVGCCLDNTESIGFARSSNFTTFTRLEGNPYIEPGSGFDNAGCLHPDLKIDMPYTMVHYAGDDGTKKTIGSAIHTSDFHNSKIDLHVSMLVYPCASLGMPPKDGCVLFDMGNFRIEVDDKNTLRAMAVVDGEEHWTTKDDIVDMKNAFGTFLVHDHWNLVIAQFTGDKIGIHRANSMPDQLIFEYFTRSPWLLAEDVAANSSNCVLERQYNWVDGVTDFGGIGQDIMFWGYGLSDGDYKNTEMFQVSRIVGVSQIFDGISPTDKFYSTLANPIGEWGFTANNIYNGASHQGVMLAQGYLWDGITLHNMNYLSPSLDANHAFDNSRTICKGGENENTQGLTKSVTGGNAETILDPGYACPPVIGNDRNGKRAWNKGFIGHVDIGLDVLDYKAHDSFGGRIDLYDEMINRSSVLQKPKWWLFNLSADGQTPNIHNSLAYYDLADWDGAKFPDKVNDNDLYLSGAAGTLADGFMGRTIFMTGATIDSAEAMLINSSFEKQNSGNSQTDISISGWDSHDVEAPHLMKANDRHHLLYTGIGKMAFQPFGEVIGDLFESGKTIAGVTLGGSFEVFAGTTVSIYLSWTKKTSWGNTPVWSYATPGVTTFSDYFVALPGVTTDFYYNVRWKIRMEANPALDASPIVNNFSIEYTAPGNVPSEAFMDEQDSPDYSQPVYKVQLVRSDTGEKIDITDRVKSISNIIQEVPVKPDELGKIVADDVTVVVENTDRHFSELYPGSLFHDRFYLNDEIRIFSGFVLPHGNEYQVTGRFYIERVEIDSKGEAQIYCRSLLREAIDMIVGLSEGNKPKPLIYAGKRKVKEIMEDLLIDKAGISAENVFIEDYDRYFSNIGIEEKPVGEVLQKLAQACCGVVYTDNQGDIYFKTWGNLPAGSYAIRPDVNLTTMRFTGQRRDRLVKECIVKGAQLVQGTCVSPSLDMGRVVTIENEYIQQTDWAAAIASNVITLYGQGEQEIELSSVYLPSVKILDTVELTENFSGLSGAKYLVNSINRNITEFSEQYKLTSNLAK